MHAREPQIVREMIVARHTHEMAILDVRPGGTFGDGHLLWANSTPLSTLELEIGDRVPRLSTTIVLCAMGTEDHHLIERAASVLEGMGYTDISYLEGGVRGWEQAGFEVFSGVNVPSKAFGEFVEHTFDTPRISPQELKGMMDQDKDFVVLDSRPMDEYSSMNIPHGIDVPGAELVLRVHDLAPDPSTTVVVNCAGRTRSIIGCQSLRNADVPNKVVALENGTMGWHLAGFDLEYGNSRRYGTTTDHARGIAQERAQAVRQRFGVRSVDLDTVKEWRLEDNRTTYILDVRDPEEFALGHLPGSRPAPGGQLVQATDEYVGTLGARIVCVDDDGVRASMTASWLLQLGWDCVILEPNTAALSAVGTFDPKTVPLPTVPEIEVRALAARMIQTHVIDVGNSLLHRGKHIPGSRFAIRANLSETLVELSQDRPIAITSEDGVLAKFAVADLIAADWPGNVMALTDGTMAWEASGLPLKTGFSDNLDAPVDVWYRPYDMDDAQEGAMKQYLSWEVNLVQQIERDGTTDFRIFD